MIVKIKKFHPDARIPEKAYDKDFCYDVYAVSEEEIAPNVWRYGFGIGFQIERKVEFYDEITKTRYDESLDDVIPYGTQGRFINFPNSPLNLSIDLRPRSSVWETGMVLSNCEGTIDEGYTNEASAVFFHVLPSMPRYKVGDKIGQIKIGTTFPIDFVEVDEFESTERGMRGYGSTGNK